MAGQMTTEQYARYVLPIIRKTWSQAANAPSGFEGLFGIETDKASVAYSQGMGGTGLIAEYNSASAEGEPAAIKYSSFSQLYEKTFTHKEYADGMAIERKLFDDDQSGIIRRRSQQFGDKFNNTVSYHKASVFNNAFSADYVGADAVALCSASHPLSKQNSDTWDNAGSTAFSYDAVVDTQKEGLDMTDDKDLPMPIIYDTIIVPTALRATALEIVKAQAKPGTADNDANALQEDRPLQLIISPWLSDTNNWFMADSRLAPQHLLWYWRVMPEVDLDPASNFNLVAKYRGYMRYSYGWDDARWLFGHEVT